MRISLTAKRFRIDYILAKSDYEDKYKALTMLVIVSVFVCK